MNNVIAAARANLDIGQTEMAEIMGVTQATISRWERDKGGEPSLSQWQRLVAAASDKGWTAERLTTKKESEAA